MKKLKDQNIKFIYIKATEGSKTQDNKFNENITLLQYIKLRCLKKQFGKI